jgi:hypothetical protein
MDSKEYIIDAMAPVLTGFDIMEDEDKQYKRYKAGDVLTVVASYSEVVHYNSEEGGMDFNIKFGGKLATGSNLTVKFDVADDTQLKSGINIIFEYVINDVDIENLRNSTGDNGRFVIDFAYNGMTDMYGNAIVAANGNLAYAQMLDNQANFEITGNDAEKDELTKRFQGFQAIDANGDNIPNQTIFEAIDEDVELGIKVYFSMQTKVDSPFTLILKEFETDENSVEFSCPSTTEEVKEVICYTTIVARNSIDITGYDKLLSGNTNQYDQLLNKVTNIKTETAIYPRGNFACSLHILT